VCTKVWVDILDSSATTQESRIISGLVPTTVIIFKVRTSLGVPYFAMRWLALT